MYFPRVLEHLLILLVILSCVVLEVTCLNFRYPFLSSNQTDFTLQNSDVVADAILVTPDVGRTESQNQSGRALYNQTFKLWDREGGLRSSFNSTFVFNLQPLSTPGGEGLAFILADTSSLPANSEGQWLGIVNQTTSGRSRIVAVEFDTKKSFSTDLDDNHVGLDNCSIISIKQEPLGVRGIDLSSGADIYASIRYDAKSSSINVYVSMNAEARSNNETPVLSQRFDLSSVLPEDVFIGFSASTGINTQINAVKSWNFTSLQIKHQEPNGRNYLLVYILTSLGAAVFLLFLGSICYWIIKRKRKPDEELEMELQILDSASAPSRFRLKQLSLATQNFNIVNKLGKGGFGTVYKGILDNKEVAVKRIKKDTHHGKKDFVAEITTIGNLNHKNLVKLHGWCYEKNELLLVYEFLPNGSLEKLIFSNGTSNMENLTLLSWERRYNIIIGVAQALNYLHNGCEKRVLHRDIKPSNIMLDSEFNARLGDFGLARKVQLNDNTHHSTKQIAGTPGYMAPECFHTGRATVETDIYAFGISILQVICGSKLGNGKDSAENHCSIVDWVWEHHGIEKIIDVVDSKLNGEFDNEQANHALVLGLACCHPNPYDRPSTRTVVQVLTGEATAPSIPSEKPAFMWPVQVPCFVKEQENMSSGGQLTLSLIEIGR